MLISVQYLQIESVVKISTSIFEDVAPNINNYVYITYMCNVYRGGKHFPFNLLCSVAGACELNWQKTE